MADVAPRHLIRALHRRGTVIACAAVVTLAAGGGAAALLSPGGSEVAAPPVRAEASGPHTPAPSTATPSDFPSSPSTQATATTAPASPTTQPEIDAISTPDPTSEKAQTPAGSGGALGGTGISLAGRVIALDPGHNGGNSSAGGTINAQVPDGRGGTKACNTVGTGTAAGYSEHAFNWDVALRTKALLEGQGATVLLTRDSDGGVGPCVDARGTFGQDNGAEIMVSIHANGTTNTKAKGYFAMISSPALNDAQGAPSKRLAEAIIDALGAQGFARSTSFSSGLYPRSDMVGLNMSTVPVTMLELGEMKNPGEASVMETEDGRQRYAQAIANGISVFLSS